MQFIRICLPIAGHISYQINQLVSIKQIGRKLWQVTFSDNQKYNVRGGDYLHQFEFIQNPTKPIYDLEIG